MGSKGLAKSGFCVALASIAALALAALSANLNAGEVHDLDAPWRIEGQYDVRLDVEAVAAFRAENDIADLDEAAAAFALELIRTAGGGTLAHVHLSPAGYWIFRADEMSETGARTIAAHPAVLRVSAVAPTHRPAVE
jgi:hypothetical protein